MHPTLDVDDETASEPEPDSSWWLDLGTEPHHYIHGCAQPDCDSDEVAASDVYCRTHEAFLGWGPQKPHALHYMAIGGLRAVIAAGFFFTALFDSMLPVWGVALLCGLAIAVLPLRLYPVNSRAAALYWLVAAAVGLELWFGTFTTQATLLTWSAYAGLAAWAALTALLANSGGGGRAGPAGEDRGAQVVAVTLTIVLPALAAAAVRAEWREAFLVVAVGGLTGALLVAAIIGVLRGGRHLERAHPPQVPYLARPLGLRWRVQFHRTRPGRPAGPIDRLARGVLAFFQVVAAGSAVGGTRAFSAVRLLGYGIAIAGTALLNWLVWISVEASRRILGSIVAAAVVMWAGLRITWATIRRATRVLLLPLAFAACAAVTFTWWAEAVRRYFADGELVTLAWIGAGTVAAATALTLIWVTLSGQALAVSLRSAQHSATIAATKGLLILALFAVALGAPGTLFDTGPIRWGWLTAGVLTLLAIATLIHFAARFKPRRLRRAARRNRTRRSTQPLRSGDKAAPDAKAQEPVEQSTGTRSGTAR
ncbi:hypothetical protein [Glycomyces harbinensis]|uniref:Uncharacterized protein n=1 Tax=Glycomyces harbinensis TaxID=58114 RepID=A0A1G6ZMF5_9ACTN|nr:hypothetical protein [Glycomyces harbinensis]SDE03974.1 hypothetical protein SAMN05216270_111103 [Glycomyces harbinensis]